jgi:hypothetical protein
MVIELLSAAVRGGEETLQLDHEQRGDVLEEQLCGGRGSPFARGAVVGIPSLQSLFTAHVVQCRQQGGDAAVSVMNPQCQVLQRL